MDATASATNSPPRGDLAPGKKSRSRSLLESAVGAVEFPLKSALFHCRACGSCLLSQTRLICPMTCPKGLRNGPCGGTLNGMCEVMPAHRCVWMRIREKEARAADAFSVRAPFDPRRLGSPSFVNFFTGADTETRLPRILTGQPAMERAPSASGLFRKLAAGKPVLTVELPSPKTLEGLSRLTRAMERMLPWADAFNTTSGAGGHAAVSSLTAAREVVKRGGEAVVQICGRDVTPEMFAAELKAAASAGIYNVLCLTGDWPAETPRRSRSMAEARDRFFPMDSSQMIHEACQAGPIGTAGSSRFFIGAAANPFSTPTKFAVARIWQKAACGADFLQTQVIFDPDGYLHWRDQLIKSDSGRRLYLLPSIPIIGTRRSVEVLENIPGVFLPPSVKAELLAGTSIEERGLDLARSLMEELIDRKAVHGFHLIPFGATAGQLREIARLARELFRLADSATQRLSK